MFIDTHCHLDFPEYNQDRGEVLSRARDGAVSYIINIGSSLQSSINSLELSQKYDFIYAAVGVHPHDADGFDDKTRTAISELARGDKVVAIGETGLDYYKNYSKAENQRLLFVTLLKLAKELNLPLVLHTRQAQEETLNILRRQMPLRAVVHCFSGDEAFLKDCLGLGFFVSFTCNITYKKAEALRRLVKIAPLERILLETDSPYLAPQEFRGARNEPSYVKYLARKIADIKEMDIDELAGITSENAKGFFNLP